MRIIRDIHQSELELSNSVLTIGTYDGVHKGHQSIIERINERAKELGGESVLITFHPHPRMVVNTEQNLELLNTLEEKFRLLQQFGVDNVVVIPFTRALSQLSPKHFVKQILVDKLNPSLIVIGYDHRFGKNREGDIHMLADLGTAFQFKVEEISKQDLDDITISSTQIRKALRAGEVKKAGDLLGYPYGLEGIVVKGKQLGRKIGYPTANISILDRHKLIPKNGVYAVRAQVNSTHYKGMLNIGVRPTVGGKSKTIEVHLFDMDNDIYGDEIRLSLIKRIRDEQHFPDLNALILQLKEDQLNAQEILHTDN